MRRRPVFLGVLLLIFSVGFGAGIASVGVMLPDPSRQGAVTTDAQTLPEAVATSQPPTMPVGSPTSRPPPSELAAEPEPETAAGASSTAPEPVRPPRALPVLHLPDRTPEPQLAALLPPALQELEGLTTGAWITQQARLEKAVLPVEPPAGEAVTVQPGDTLMNILMRAGIAPADAHSAVSALMAVYDPRRLQAGQQLLITSADGAEGEPPRLIGLAFELNFDHEIRITRDTEGAFAGEKVERPQRRELVHRAGIIDDSLYLSAERAALPQNLVLELIKLFSWDVDFQRDIRPADAFEATFEEVSLEGQADAVRGGDLLHARLTLSGRELDAYRFERPDGTVEYFDRTGRSLRKFLLRTPVDGARISSRFGMRKHPILGYSRMHKGVDFAAPSGTPIFAAGDGRVAMAGRNGGYGNYVRINHNGEYATAYAHLSRIAKGVAGGARVRQGQVIGYVGTTGRSTGPHLHYEVLRHDQQMNPLKLKHPALAQLGEKELERFQAEIARIDRLRGKLQNGTQIASTATPEAGRQSH